MANYCNNCLVHIQDKCSYESHLTSKRHLRNTQFHFQCEEFKKRILDCSIFVPFSPSSTSLEELIPFFLQYGSIRTYKIGKNYVIIEFNNSETVDYLLNNEIVINNKKLNIKRRILNSNYNKYKPNRTTETEDVINFDFVKSKFIQDDTFDKQLVAFLNAVQLSTNEFQTRYEPICEHLKNIFISKFPTCRIFTFGSSMTGLGFKNCDLDIYMYIGKPIISTPKGKEPIQTPDKSLETLTMEDLFKRVRKTMYKKKGVFSNIKPVLAAKTPIIKFCYIPTNVSCDISFKHGIGVYKSLLTKHCLSLDKRIKPLMILIKYWARQCEISGCRKISNYAIVLLVIFYLQQPEPGILPPLMEFQKTCTPIIYNDWQVSFDENTVLPPITNKSSIPELLQGFFEFYTQLDFTKSVICPLDGQIHTKKEFEEIKNLPSYMAQYKEVAETKDLKLNIRNTCNMCIQDPIELNHNIMSSTPNKIIDSFYLSCEISAKICIEARKNNYKDLLVALFSRVRQPEQPLTFTIMIKAVKYLFWNLPHNLYNCNECKILTLNNENTAENKQNRKEILFCTIINIIMSVLKRVYKLKMKILSADNETKQQIVCVFSDLHANKCQEFLLHCKGNINAWHCRESKLTNFDDSMSPIEKEEAISNNALKKYVKQDLRRITLDFMCKVQIDYNEMEIQMLITDNKSRKKEFKFLSCNLLSKLPKIVRKTLMHIKNANICK